MAPPPSVGEAQGRAGVGGESFLMERGEEGGESWTQKTRSSMRRKSPTQHAEDGRRSTIAPPSPPSPSPSPSRPAAPAAAPAAADDDGTARRNKSRSSRQLFSLAEVARHDMPDDCWLIIRGKVYDVTTWVPKHPGGSLIYVRAGKDCTHLFDCYHPLYVRGMLDKYCIGEVERREEEVSRRKKEMLEYIDDDSQTKEDDQEEEFYTVMKRRVEALLREKKINPRVSPAMYVKSALILLGYMLCYYGTFFFFTDRDMFVAAVLCAIGMGFLMAEVGVSIQHDCNHGAYAPWQPLCYLLGTSLDIVGASSFMWKQQHVVGHHQYTNVDDFDPDIRVKDPDVRRVTTKQPWRAYQSYQHIYLALLYGVLSLKSVFIDDFSAYFSGQIGNVKISRMTTAETVIFFGGKVLYVLYILVLPLLCSPHSIDKLLGLYVLAMLVSGWTLAFMFQVAHIVEDAQFPEADRSGDRSKVRMGWAAAQAATSTGFSHGSMFWTHISGGLNYQLEHHLFPGMCHLHYPIIQPIVRATCKEFGVPYHAYPSFWAALRAHFAWLRKVGMQGMEWRLAG